jgi:Ca2+-binding EF-hand superfamily protein/mono/diheme cytochrome c family protein/thiol-disulfide isomerase/thioredoxin
MHPSLLLTFSLLGLCLAATAQESDGVFERYDRNRDGKVMADELPSKATFARFDLDKDGAITMAEYQKVSGKTAAGGEAVTPSRGLSAQIESMIKAVDKNADGQITKEEAAGAPWFTKLDQDGDGVVSAAELTLMRRIVAAGAGSAGKKSAVQAPAITAEDVKKVTSGPEMLKPGEVGIGRMIDDVKFRTLDGKELSLGSFKDRKGLVIVMTSATCPVSKRYLPSVAKLAAELKDQGLGLLLVNALVSEKPEDIRSQLAAAGVTAPYVHDTEKKLSLALGARTTTEVFLIDAARSLVYRGALDDQYGISYNLDAPKHPYLRDAVAALLRGEKPAVQATAAPGCELDLPAAADAKATSVTYHRDVARILQQNCVSCHRADGIAPFALDDIDEVKDRAKVIRRVVNEGSMPPWFAAIDKDADKNPWANDCSLSAKEKADLFAWIDSKDRPLGDAADAPAKRRYPAEWSIGKPDLVVQLSKANDIKADGFMPYANDIVETELKEDRWVSAYEILPSERDVVHHVIVRVHEKGSEVRKADEGREGYWAIYVPGNGACVYPEGFARKIPAGAKVSFQIHYTPSGKAKKERLKMGLVFAKKTPTHEIRTAPLANPRLSIPPGAARHVETHTQRVPFDMPIMGFMPHMHTRGTAFKYEVTYADGKTETLLDIPRYDFNWQLRYDYKRPKLIPQGSTLKITAVFDNSTGNKANPDPTKLVRWGSQTVDEMMIGYIEYFRPL